MRFNSPLITYMIVGCANALFGYLTFLFLFFLLKNQLHYLVILTISNVLYLPISHFAFRVFAFKSKAKILGESLRYYAVFSLCILLNYLGMLLFVSGFHMNPTYALIFASSMSMMAGYLGNNLFTFRTP